MIRECREELGVDIMLGPRVGRDWAIGEHGVLRVWLATIARANSRRMSTRPFDGWTVDELHDVPWLAADLPRGRLSGMLRASVADR